MRRCACLAVIAGAAMLLLAACAGQSTPTPPLTSTPQPTATLTPIPRPTEAQTAQPSPTTARPTVEPTAAATQVAMAPMIEVGETKVPDPRVSNPELFDLKNPNAPIPQFVNAMKMAGIEVTAEQVTLGITFQELKGKDGNPLVVAVYNLNPDPTKTSAILKGPIPLVITRKNEKGEWRWTRTTPKQLDKILSFETGAAGIHYWIKNKPDYGQTLLDNFSLVMSEEFHFKYLSPSKNRYVFSEEADPIVDFASKNGMRMQAHHLIWKRELPDWLLNGEFTREQMIDILRNHITTLMTRYKGLVNEWTVVNEAVWTEGGKSGWVKSPWYTIIGQSYVEEAFEIARATDPNAILIYNDDILEPGANGVPTIISEKQVEQVYEIVKNLTKIQTDQGKPIIDAVGFQMHMDAAYPPDFNRLKEIIDLWCD
jgi:hypothetical protein